MSSSTFLISGDALSFVKAASMSGAIGAGVRVCASAPGQANSERARTEPAAARAGRYEKVIEVSSEGMKKRT